MKKIAFIIIWMVLSPLTAQDSIDTDLKQQLDTLLFKDQILREIMMGDVQGTEKDAALMRLGYPAEEYDQKQWYYINLQDSLNLLEAETILAKYGYPGKSLVGAPTNTAIWYVVQHSDKIEKYFPVIEKAGKEGELAMRLVAMMQDRLLMNQGKEQIYGTQVAGRQLPSTADTSEPEWFYFVWPIEHAEKVNERRKKVGFDTTVEESAQSMDVDYKAYSLKEIDALLKPKEQY